MTSITLDAIGAMAICTVLFAAINAAGGDGWSTANTAWIAGIGLFRVVLNVTSLHLVVKRIIDARPGLAVLATVALMSIVLANAVSGRVAEAGAAPLLMAQKAAYASGVGLIFYEIVSAWIDGAVDRRSHAEVALRAVRRVALTTFSMSIAILLLVWFFTRSTIADSMNLGADHASAAFATLLAIGTVYLTAKVVDLFIGRHAKGRRHRSPETGAYMSASTATRVKRTDREVRHIASHEAGHVLMFAAYRPALPSIFATIEPAAGSNGRVSSSRQLKSVMTEPMLEWEMLLNLAGDAAETKAMGLSGCGNGTDYASWMTLADTFLSQQRGAMYYATPKTALEQAHNADALTRLLSEQRRILSDFLHANESVLSDLTDELSRVKTMNADQMAPFIGRVTIVDGVPEILEAEEKKEGGNV